MKKVIQNLITFSIAIVGLIGGIIWAVFYNGGVEALILVTVSILEVFGFFILKEDNLIHQGINNSNQNINFNVNIDNTENSNHNIENHKEKDITNIDRNAIINSMKSKSKILFIDDDKNFNIVKILKDSGWKNTKTIVDIKSIDLSIVDEADIIFVDINGVGKLLKLQGQGLDLALMLKRKYNNKKIGIYSANPNSNSFHEAWDIIDFKLEKNALPLQFQSIVERYSVELYKK